MDSKNKLNLLEKIIWDTKIFKESIENKSKEVNHDPTKLIEEIDNFLELLTSDEYAKEYILYLASTNSNIARLLIEH